MTKTKLLLPFGAAGVFLAACLAAPSEPTNSSRSAISCAANERSFNGGCHAVCTKNADCQGLGTLGTTCMTVSEGLALCLDYTQCGYFGSDTTCAGAPYGYGDEGYFSDDPYGSLPTSYSPEGYGGAVYGCTGNASFILAPVSPTADPKCGAPHPVTRCQKIGNTCAFVSGSTIDVAEH